MFHEQEGYPVTNLCRFLSLSRSSYYYHLIERDEAELRGSIETIAAEFVKYGSRRVTHELRRSPYEIVVNRKRIQRLDARDGIAKGAEAA